MSSSSLNPSADSSAARSFLLLAATGACAAEVCYDEQNSLCWCRCGAGAGAGAAVAAAAGVAAVVLLEIVNIENAGFRGSDFLAESCGIGWGQVPSSPKTS